MDRNWMWLVVLITGITSVLGQAQTIEKTPDRYATQNIHKNERRFACPVGFFRLGRNCYYLSAGMASWRDAYFYCKDRNSTLATLNKPGKNKILRRYLMNEQFRKLERWIGGIYNWKQMTWEWGSTGEKITYQNFNKLKSQNSTRYAWHCIIMDPALKYKWNAKTCVEQKYYVCETPVGRQDRSKRRGMINDPGAPQNLVSQKVKKKERKRDRKDRLKKKGKNRPLKLDKKLESSMWMHGVKLGSRPPIRTQQMNSKMPVKPYAFQGSINYHKPQSLDKNTIYTSFDTKMNDFAVEEILLKP